MKAIIMIGLLVLLVGCNSNDGYITLESEVNEINTSNLTEDKLYINNNIKLVTPKELNKIGVAIDSIEAGDYIIIKELEKIYIIEKLNKDGRTR